MRLSPRGKVISANAKAHIWAAYRMPTHRQVWNHVWFHLFVVLIDAIGSFRFLSGSFGSFRILSGSFESFRILSDSCWLFRVLTGPFGLFRVLSGPFGSFRALSSVFGSVRIRSCPFSVRVFSPFLYGLTVIALFFTKLNKR